MKLKELQINLEPSYSDLAGKYVARVKYESEHGETVLTLDHEISERLLAFIGPAITACAHKTSLKLEESLKLSLQEAQRLPELEAVNVQ